MNKKSGNTEYILKLIGFVFLIFISGCNKSSNLVSDDSLFNGFIDPPSGARPFVRWWWNGNHLEREEIIRQLDVLQKAGIGGVFKTSLEEIKFIEGPWEVFFEHTNSESFSMNFSKLEDFGASANPKLHNFAGTVTYKTEFISNDKFQ